MSRSAPASPMTAMTNHSVSGTSAIAVIRCPTSARRPPWPSRARSPGPAASASAIHRAMSAGSAISAVPSATMPATQATTVRTAVAASTAQPPDRRCAVRGRGRYPTTDAACRCTDGRTARRSSRTAATGRSTSREIPAPLGIGFRPVGGGDQPPHQQDRADAQRDPGSAVQDRQHRGQLPAIDLEMRRQRPRVRSHADIRFRQSTVSQSTV